MSQDRYSPAPGVDVEALDWALRMADPAHADWDAFTAWLEADPSHVERYDRMAATLLDAEEALAAHPDLLAEPQPVGPVEHRRGALRWIGGAAAAALVGAIGLQAWEDRARPYAVETAAAETRDVPLSDGTVITLAGGSRIVLDHADPRRAVLERGEALFRVRHDDRHPFAVRAGDVALVDLGTVFDVRMGARQTRVAVAEGAVMVDPKGAALRLDAGQGVTVEKDRLIRAAVDPGDVGGWRDGRLAFDGAPLSEVAEDLSRFMRQPVSVAPAIAARPFRGVIDLQAVRRDPTLLGPLMEVRVRRDAAGWTLEPRG